MDSLPLDPDEDPCDTKGANAHTRWRKLLGGAGGCTSHGGASALDAASVLVYEHVFNKSTDTNPFVKDTVLSKNERELCTAAAKPTASSVGGTLEGTRLEIRWKNGAELAEPECWEHTNKNTLDVYDFSRWSLHHGGNAAASGFYPIKKVALDGEAVLHFPSWHSLDRWTGNSNAEWRALTFGFGRLGDMIRFTDLPQPIRSAGFAEAMGISVSPTQDQSWIEMCGQCENPP